MLFLIRSQIFDDIGTNLVLLKMQKDSETTDSPYDLLAH